MRLLYTLETKFVALASVLILLSSIIANSWIINTYRDRLISDAEKQASLLAKSTAISFTNTLLYEQLDLVREGGLLDNYIQVLISDSSTSVIGITAYGDSGEVISTSDYTYYFESPPHQDLGLWRTLSEIRFTRHSNGDYFEVLAPLAIAGKRFGTLNMTFTLADEFAQLKAFRNLMFFITTGITAIGILIAFLVARTLASPIKRLVVEMHKVKGPHYVTYLDSKRADEIGELERGFVEMLNRLKSAADERERQQKALMQTEKLASVGTFVSGLAHEINNPLSGIRACLRRIIARPGDGEQTTKYAKLMDDAWLRIEQVVKGLLNFSRNKELVFQPADLNQIVMAACSLVDYRRRSQKVELQQDLATVPPVIAGDPHQLEQVFVNLLLNAIDATFADGWIRIRTRQNEDNVVAEVSDSGQGIPSDIQDKIFDPFFTTKPVGRGTGLGLSVTNTIVDEHCGRIEVLSGDTGTTFRLYFPKSSHLVEYEGAPA